MYIDSKYYILLFIILSLIYIIYIHLNFDLNIIKIEYQVKGNKILKYKKGEFELYEIENILTNNECDELINISKNIGLEQSNVLKSQGEQLNLSDRISEQLWLPNNHNNIIKKLSDYNMTLTKLPYENQENIQIVHYYEGGLFKLHADGCVYDKKTCDVIANRNNSGQRKSTLLVYLNDNFEAGETEFPSLNIKIIPKKGKGIFFYNVDSYEKILYHSYHKGNPVVNGEKWIATIWTHVNKFI
jgi:prolyl 4-hydroxylase